MRNFKIVPYLIFGDGAFGELQRVVRARLQLENPRIAYVVDDCFKTIPLPQALPTDERNQTWWISTADEPKTWYVDPLAVSMRAFAPQAIVGLGGGTTLDIAKVLAVLMTNPGSCADYQGWDLVKQPATFKVGIPTVAGTGAEVSRTAVLTSPVKRQGINSDFTLFDQILLDPTLLRTVPRAQRFYTGMDCYIHSVESLRGTFLNGFSRAHAEQALAISAACFMNNGSDEDLMAASYLGGMSIVHAEVGICHALSYGLSFVLGLHHGEANCIAFDQLEEYYGEDVRVFRRMLQANGVQLRRGVTRGVTEAQLQKMIELTYLMEKPLTNALGPKFREILTPAKIVALYRAM